MAFYDMAKIKHMNFKVMKTLKRFFIIILIIISISFLTLMITSYFYGDKICNLFINEINKNIKTEIIVEKTRLDLFSSFPNVSVRFINITIKPVKGFNYFPKEIENSDNVLHVKELSLEFSLIKLIFNSYIINGISVNDGYINIIYTNTGEANFKFWNDNSKRSSNFRIKNILLTNTKLSYYKNGNFFKAQLDLFKLNGIIKDEFIDASFICKTKTFCFLNSKENYYFNHSLAMDLNIKSDSLQFKIQKWGKLSIDKNRMYINGSISINKPYLFSSDVRVDNLNLLLLSQIPQIKFPSNIKIIKGTTTGALTLSGNLNDFHTINPDINLTFDNMIFCYNNNKFEIPKCYFRYHKNNTGELFELNSMRGFFDHSKFSITSAYNFTEKKFIKLKAEVWLDALDLNKFSFMRGFYFTQGNAVVNFKLKKPSILFDNNTKKFDFSNLIITGKTENLGINDSSKNIEIKKLSSEIEIGDNRLNIILLKCNFDNANIVIKTSINHINNIVNDSIKYIDANGDIHIECLNLGRLFAEKTNSNSLPNSINIHANFNFQVDSIIYNKALINNALGYIKYNNNSFNIVNVKAKICNGELINGFLKISNENTGINAQTSFQENNINISELFKSFENFGQNELTADNIQGNINSLVSANLYFDSKGNFDKIKSQVDANISLTNAQLLNFKPLYSLSKFISVEELSNLKFNKLNNKISLCKNNIIIPSMDIKTSAFNLTISGIHSLDNAYEYHFKVLLSDLLFRKASKKNKKMSEFGKVEEDTIGKTSIFVKLKGQNSDYHYSYDSKQAVGSFSEKIITQKKQLKQIFKEEFGLYKNDSTIQSHNQKGINIKTDYPDENSSVLKSNPQKDKKKNPKQKIDWDDR